MDQNFTPLTEEQKAKTSRLNMVLLVVATLTAIVLAVVLFFLIRQRMQDQGSFQNQSPTVPQVGPSAAPTEVVLPSESPTATPSTQLIPSPASGEGVLVSPTPAPSQ